MTHEPLFFWVLKIFDFSSFFEMCVMTSHHIHEVCELTATCFPTELLGPRGALDCGGNAVCCCFTKPGLGQQWSRVCAESTQKPSNRPQQSGWVVCGTVRSFPNLFSMQKSAFGWSHKQRICRFLKKSVYPCSFSWKPVYFVVRAFLLLEFLLYNVPFRETQSLKTIILWQSLTEFVVSKAYLAG